MRSPLYLEAGVISQGLQPPGESLLWGMPTLLWTKPFGKSPLFGGPSGKPPGKSLLFGGPFEKPVGSLVCLSDQHSFSFHISNRCAAHFDDVSKFMAARILTMSENLWQKELIA